MRIHGSNVWRGHNRAATVHGNTHVERHYCVESHYRVEGTLPCGGGIYVWELFTCGGDITVQLPYMVINVWRGITVWRAITVWRGHYRVERRYHMEGAFTCGSYSRVEGTLPCSYRTQ